MKSVAGSNIRAHETRSETARNPSACIAEVNGTEPFPQETQT
jgi:hypothetical protein